MSILCHSVLFHIGNIKCIFNVWIGRDWPYVKWCLYVFITISIARLFTHTMHVCYIHLHTLTSICEMSTIISNTNQPGVAMAIIQNTRASARNTRAKICPAFFVIVAVKARNKYNEKKNKYYFQIRELHANPIYPSHIVIVANKMT